MSRRPEGTSVPRLILAAIVLSCAGRAEIANITITSAATYEKGRPSGGSIASVFCTGLKGINGVISADRYPLPLELAGVRVTIGETRAPLFAVADLGGYQQINLQVPWEEQVAASIVIQQGGETGSAPGSSLLLPGDFFRLPDGAGAFQHADYALISTGNPARAGEVVIGYLTGLGVRPAPPIPTGQPSPVGQPSWENTVLRTGSGESRKLWEIWVGDDRNPKAVAPSFLGLTPGLAGVYQVNFTVPEGLAPGSQPVRLVQWRCSTLFGVCVGFRHDTASRPVQIAVK